MPFVYIIYSASLDRYYVGLTTASPQERLKKHNDAAYGSKHFTSSASDWILKLEIECDNNSIARKAEIYIKRMKSRKFIERFGNGVVWF
jgi:putative endonuclease